MSWSNTYSHTVLYGLDVLGAALFWNQTDVTISSLAGVVHYADAGWLPFKTVLESLKLYRWQIAVLRWLYPRLDRIQAGHCESAITADIARARRILRVLEPK